MPVVFVANLETGDTIAVHGVSSVAQLKRKIYAKSNIPPESQIIIQDGNEVTSANILIQDTDPVIVHVLDSRNAPAGIG